MTKVYARRGSFCAVMVGVFLVLAGCSTSPRTPEQQAEARQAAQAKLTEKLSEADQALTEGKTDQALALLSDAARIDPASKQPWLKKAQIRFDARQYGEAITFSHEVLQRDVNDLTAKSILAVSGLRVSAQALDELRKANEVSGSARSEAETVAKLIKEVLGEPILVPAPEAEAKPVRRPVRPRRAPVTPSAAGATTPPAQVAAAPAPAAPVAAAPAVRPATPAAAPAAASNRSTPPSAGRGNPFGALK